MAYALDSRKYFNLTWAQLSGPTILPPSPSSWKLLVFISHKGTWLLHEIEPQLFKFWVGLLWAKFQPRKYLFCEQPNAAPFVSQNPCWTYFLYHLGHSPVQGDPDACRQPMRQSEGPALSTRAIFQTWTRNIRNLIRQWLVHIPSLGLLPAAYFPSLRHVIQRV